MELFEVYSQKRGRVVSAQVYAPTERDARSFVSGRVVAVFRVREDGAVAA